MEPTDLTNLTELAAEIVSAYVSKTLCRLLTCKR